MAEKKEDYMVYDRTFEKYGGTFKVDSRVYELSKYIQEKNRRILEGKDGGGKKCCGD